MTRALISDFSKFKTAWERDSGSPENSVLYYMMAALMVEQDPALAEAMMTVVVSKDHVTEDGKSPSGFKLRSSAAYYVGQFRKNPHIARSYVGGNPDNNYQYSKNELRLTVVRVVEQGDNTLKLFISSSGKDMPTPVTVARNNKNQWKLIEYSSLCTGVRPPKGSADF